MPRQNLGIVNLFRGSRHVQTIYTIERGTPTSGAFLNGIDIYMCVFFLFVCVFVCCFFVCLFVCLFVFLCLFCLVLCCSGFVGFVTAGLVVL